MYAKLEDLLAATPPETRDIDVPGLGTVKIRALTVAEQQAMRKRATIGKNINQELLELHLVQTSLVEPAVPVSRVDELKNMPFRAFNFIAAEVLALNGMTEEAAQSAETTFPEQ